jgi:hypothetical protein
LYYRFLTCRDAFIHKYQIFQFPRVFSIVTCSTPLSPRSNKLFHEPSCIVCFSIWVLLSSHFSVHGMKSRNDAFLRINPHCLQMQKYSCYSAFWAFICSRGGHWALLLNHLPPPSCVHFFLLWFH